MSKNMYNLSRAIPPEIKREIRKNSGFGCIICGTAIVEYDHVDPEFKYAKEHDSNKMTLLCPNCHSKKTRKFLSKETILEYMRNPITKKQGFSQDCLDLDLSKPLIVKIGNCTFEDVHIPIMMSSIPLITILRPEENSKYAILSAKFYDCSGNNTLIIQNNEWKASSDVWDLEVTSGRIYIKENSELRLSIKNEGRNIFNVEYLETLINGTHVKTTPNGIVINAPDSGIQNINISVNAKGGYIGLSL